MTQANIEHIFQMLPHRYPFLLVDRVIDMVPGDSLVAIKNVTINENFFVGHFPSKPIMPGVLILEAMAQASGLLSFYSVDQEESKNAYLYLAGVDDARFKRVVIPGDQLRIEVKLTRRRADFWKFFVQSTVDSELACSATIIAAKKE